MRHHTKEEDRRRKRDIGTIRRNHVPSGKRIRVVGITTRHAGKPQEVLREEGQVDANEEEPEVDLRTEIGNLVARHFAEPIVEASKDREDSAKCATTK